MMRVVKHWYRFPREVVGALPLETSRLDGTLSSLLQLRMFLPTGGGLDQTTFKSPSQPTLFLSSQCVRCMLMRQLAPYQHTYKKLKLLIQNFCVPRESFHKGFFLQQSIMSQKMFFSFPPGCKLNSPRLLVDRQSGGVWKVLPFPLIGKPNYTVKGFSLPQFASSCL